MLVQDLIMTLFGGPGVLGTFAFLNPILQKIIFKIIFYDYVGIKMNIIQTEFISTYSF